MFIYHRLIFLSLIYTTFLNVFYGNIEKKKKTKEKGKEKLRHNKGHSYNIS